MEERLQPAVRILPTRPKEISSAFGAIWVRESWFRLRCQPRQPLDTCFGVVDVSHGGNRSRVGLFSFEINVVVMAAPIMIMTLAIADCIHLHTSYVNSRLDGLDTKTAWARSIDSNWIPVVITSFMTAAGFLSLHFSDSPPYRVLGYIAATGVIVACILYTLFHICVGEMRPMLTLLLTLPQSL